MIYYIYHGHTHTQTDIMFWNQRSPAMKQTASPCLPT